MLPCTTGGEAHIDVYGVRYEKDPLTGKVGTASDFGKQLVIGRVPPGDQVSKLYFYFLMYVLIFWWDKWFRVFLIFSFPVSCIISSIVLLQVLYQTERYHHSTFGYEIPLKGDGEYVLVLKFSEVYFNAPDQKVSWLYKLTFYWFIDWFKE